MVLSHPALTGREEELEELKHSIDSVLSGKGKTIFIAGKAGSGKTRLTNEFLKITRKRDVTILSGWCLSNTTLPYFPFIEAFSSDITSKGGGAVLSMPLGLKSWLSENSPIRTTDKSRNIVPQVWKDQAFAVITRELLYLASVKPLILVLEDMHWADSASLSLLHYISRAIINEKILVLVTFRREELNRDAEGRLHPLVETVKSSNELGEFAFLLLQAKDPAGSLKRRKHQHDGAGEETNSTYNQVNMNLRILADEGIVFDCHVGRMRSARLNRESLKAQRLLKALRILASHNEDAA